MSAPRILVVRGGAIGDFIMTLPAIGALRERWPDARIEILGYPHIAALACPRHYADGMRSIEARALAGFFVPNGGLDPSLVEYFGGFNVVLSYLFDPDDVFADNVRRCGVKQFLPGSPRPVDLPAARHYCKPLESLAVYVDDPQPRLFPIDADRESAKRFWGEDSGCPLAALHAGSGSEKKNWPVEKFAAVAEWLIEQRGMKLALVEGEADTRVVGDLSKRLSPRKFRRVAGLKLVELAAVLQCCSVYVGNDSGITHLATAVGTPTVAMFGPHSSGIWEPRGERVRVVRFGNDDVIQVQAAVEALSVS